MAVSLPQGTARFYSDAMRALANAAMDRARPKIRSRALQQGLKITKGRKPNIAYLYIPHYWAVYLHDDRNAFGPRRARWLVWFENPADDPRLAGGYPERFADVKRLTKEQFRQGMVENRLRRAHGERPFMHVRKFAPGRKGDEFFSVGLKDMDDVADSIMPAIFDKFVRSVVPREQRTTKVRLG